MKRGSFATTALKSVRLNLGLRAFSRLPESESRKSTLEIDAFERSKLLQRPISPHLTIYRPQITWIVSIGHRVTGAGLALGMYFGAISIGLGLTSTTDLVSAIHSIPVLFYTAKVLGASSFVFHSLNGIRHLVILKRLIQVLGHCFFLVTYRSL